MSARPRVGLVVPALDEEQALPLVLAELPPGAVDVAVVVDNGSRDRTAEVARRAGAFVVPEPRKGYGQACLAGLAALLGEHPDPALRVEPPLWDEDVVVFLDGDHSDFPQDLPRLLAPLARGEADLVLMSRKMRPDEAKRILDRGLGNVLSPAQEHELAPGGVAVVVHPSNAVKTLQLQQVADIIAGRIRNWGEVGGTPRRIQVFVPEEGAGVLDFFREKILPGADLMATAKRVESNAEMADIVGSDPAAIGFVEYSYVGNTMPLSFTDSCGRQIGPNEFTLQTRDYPLSTPLYLYTSNRITPAARAFLNFALSKPGQVALKQGGLTSFLPVAQPRRTFDAVAADWPVPSRPVAAELKRFMTSSTRMSVTLGFSEGLQLSRDSERELGRLTSFLQTEADGTRLVLLGFSDRSANFGSDVRLSERRAQLVEQKLKQKGVKTERVFGLGPLLPVSCDKSPEGSARNRRVEAWVY